MASKSILNDEKRWRAESDAETMARYQEIMNDKTRMEAAVKMAKERAADLNKRAAAMSSVAKSASHTKSKSTKKK